MHRLCQTGSEEEQGTMHEELQTEPGLGAPYQAQRRAKDLKANTRRPKNLTMIHINSPELMCFVNFPGH